MLIVHASRCRAWCLRGRPGSDQVHAIVNIYFASPSQPELHHPRHAHRQNDVQIVHAPNGSCSENSHPALPSTRPIAGPQRPHSMGRDAVVIPRCCYERGSPSHQDLAISVARRALQLFPRPKNLEIYPASRPFQGTDQPFDSQNTINTQLAPCSRCEYLHSKTAACRLDRRGC